eukprot:Sspe_Gene.67477::Locus_39809_Transcript_1_1_Confidence_1.000_Length_1547::g.67477::m.67477/K01206/FUCA; alpha-L-fucosidase
MGKLELLLLLGAASSLAVRPDYKHASKEAVEKWHDMKFGLRIHWGLYSSGVATGTAVGPESWPLTQGGPNMTFDTMYWEQDKKWNPKKFDPNQWMAMMKDAGITFFDFTTKHHEGFSMYHTETQVYNCWKLEEGQSPKIVPCSPSPRPFSSVEAFGRDVTGEIIAAARKAGVIPGLYFSHIDWYDTDFRIDDYHPFHKYNVSYLPPGQDQQAWDRFVLRHRAQIMEVLTKYGPICELSLDMNFPRNLTKDPMGPGGEVMDDTIMLARLLAPDTLFRIRGIGDYGDYDTPEEVFPDKPKPGNWQVIYHGSKWMSYDPDPANYVNGSFIIWHLVDIVAKGGLMQIGYGPDGDGEFHPKAVEALKYVGTWMRINSEAIYSTRAFSSWNDTLSQEVRYTRTKDNSTVYATSLGWPSSTLNLACVRGNTNSTVSLLGWQGTLKWTNTANSMNIEVPQDAKSKLVDPGYVFKISSPAPHAC